MNMYRKEAEDKERQKPLKSGRLRTFGTLGSPLYAFDGDRWFVRMTPGLWVRCRNVPEVGLWVSGHIDRTYIAEKKA